MNNDINWRYAVPDPITEEIALDAMTIWEAVLERSRADWRAADDKFYQWFTGEDGVCEGRQIALTIAPRITAAWASIAEDYGNPFDWAFVPDILDQMFQHHDSPDVDQETLNQYALEILRDYEQAQEDRNLK